jgi:hypothetical protein
LSNKSCTRTTQDGEGNVYAIEEFTGTDLKKLDDNQVYQDWEQNAVEGTYSSSRTLYQSDVPGEEISGSLYQDIDCTIQTPGQTIVDQLGWAQSSTIREMELVKDLDAIFNALANMAIRTGASYFTSMISGGGGSSQATINNNYLNDLQAQIDNQMNTPNTLSYDTSGNLNFTRSINSATTKQFALDTINSQIAIELQYFNVQKTNVFKLLDGAQNAFTASKSIGCTPAIKSEIINQITGSSTARDLSWNKKDLNDALTQTNNNIAALSTVRDMVATNTDDLAIPSLVQSLTTLTTLHTTAMTMSYYPGGSAFAPIQNWIIWKTSDCSIPSDELTLMGII